jgi:hypothetical protein
MGSVVLWSEIKNMKPYHHSSAARFGTNHPWEKGIQVCSNEGEHPSPRGDDSKRVKIV